jgi:hypothetical protein
MLACWTDDAQNVLRVDASRPVQGTDWQRIVFEPDGPPAQAMAVCLVAVARGGPVWFDDFELLRLRPGQPRAQVYVNQVGYDRAGPKSLVIASNFFPTNGDVVTMELVSVNTNPRTAGLRPAAASQGRKRSNQSSGLSNSDLLRLTEPRPGSRGRVVWKQSAICSGRIHSGQSDDWGWYFRRVDFSQFQKPGAHRAVARLGSAMAESAPFLIGRNLLLSETAQSAVDFFFRPTLRLRCSRLAQSVSSRRREASGRHALGRDGWLAQRRRLQQTHV